MTNSRETAKQTVWMLEERLRRLDYVLTGHVNDDIMGSSPDKPQASALTRLMTLERTLSALTAKSHAVSDVLALQKKFPDLFHPASGSDVSTTLPPASLASLVLAHARLYSGISARLTQLQDTSIPDPAASTKLIELRPRLEKVQSKQREQAIQVADLRVRSAQAVETWYEGGILGMGERWADWEERLRDAEILVRRREAAKKRDDGVV